MKKDIVASLFCLLALITTGTTINEAERCESSYDYETKVLISDDFKTIEITDFKRPDLITADLMKIEHAEIIKIDGLKLNCEGTKIVLEDGFKNKKDNKQNIDRNKINETLNQKDLDVDLLYESALQNDSQEIQSVAKDTQKQSNKVDDKIMTSSNKVANTNNKVTPNKEEATNAITNGNIQNNIQTQIKQDEMPKQEAQKPKICTSHELYLYETKVIDSYQLYNYVSDNYKCKNCNYTESTDHRAYKNASQNTLLQAENEIVNLVNQLRASNGLSKLWTDSAWNIWAKNRATSIASNYTHIGWTNAIGNTYTLAENIASGQASSTDFYEAFFNSPSHKGAMLKADAVGIAVGIYINNDGQTFCAMSIIAER